jgi:hypothetical protein
MTYRVRPRTRLDLFCESLESRQLLSTITTSAPDPTQITAQPNLQVLPLVSPGPSGLSPQQIAGAYGVNQIKFSGGKVVGNGAGQTIAIVTAYNDPNIGSDLAAFDSQFGLASPPSLTVKNLGGTATDAGWALETSLDVEWAHALAPAAKILLVEAVSSSLADLFSAVSYASNQAGVSVVSMSWGTNEFWGQWSYDRLFTTPAGHAGVTYVAASGDSGAWNGPMYPSVSPNVLAVGGTSLTLSGGSSYGSESGWSGSTGGFSGYDSYWWFYETAPSYQVAAQQAVGLNYGVRTTPDVSFNADPISGVAVYDSVSYAGQSGWFQLGGTSAAAPAWAGLIAIANQGLATGGKGPLSGTQAQTDLYALPSSDFHVITTGANGYAATPGYDLVTGLGSPKANLVIAGLLSANGVSESPVTGQVSVSTTTKTAHTSSTQLDLTSSPASGSGSVSGSSNSGPSTISIGLPASLLIGTAQSTGPLTMQALTTPAIATFAQPTAAQAPAGTSISQTAVLATPVGQSIAEQVSSTSRSLVIEKATEPVGTTDEAAPAPLSAPADVTPPVEEMPPAPLEQEPLPRDPGQVADPPADPAQPTDDLPQDLFDLALGQVGMSMAARRRELPAVMPLDLPTASEERPVVSLSALAGTAVLAAGGYRLVLGRAARIRKCWSGLRYP